MSLVHRAGTRKSFTYSVPPCATSRSTLPLMPETLPVLAYCQNFHGCGLGIVGKSGFHLPYTLAVDGDGGGSVFCTSIAPGLFWFGQRATQLSMTVTDEFT